MTKNTLYYGDNLDVLRLHVKDESVDLIYMDPPFNSNQSYNLLFKEQDGSRSAAQIKAFEDTWRWDDDDTPLLYRSIVEAGGDVARALECFRAFLGQKTTMLAYLTMMAPRLVELHRVLKSTGSLYLHCDPAASHYLKLLLDAAFGPENFLAEVVWQRTNGRSTKGKWPRLHDVILNYRKGPGASQFFPVAVRMGKKKLPHTLITGKDGKKYQTYELTGAGVTKNGESGKPWRGFDVTKMGRHWGNRHSQMDEWDKKGLIHWPRNRGFPRRRAGEPFNVEDRTVVVGDVWTDIDRLNQTAKERLGYPTQKPEALIERIVRASSREGDTVLDPFCGCGTAVSVAQKLGRRWLGIDITHHATAIIKSRLHIDAQLDAADDYVVMGEPTTLSEAQILAASDTHQFEHWALGLVHARASAKGKGADGGIDGWLGFYVAPNSLEQGRVIVSVKSGKNVGVSMVRELGHVVEREKAAIGVLILMSEPTRPMRAEAAQAGSYVSEGWNTRHPKLQILTVENLLHSRHPAKIDAPPTS